MNIPDFEAMYLDLPKIAAASELPTYITKLANELLRYQYISTGDYFKMLDDVELYELENAVENVHSKNMRQFTITSEQVQQDLYNIALFSIMLAAGEGESELAKLVVPDYMASLMALVAVETLFRKGLIVAYRENYSVIDGSKTIASKL